jgi:hypothetical protein
LEDSDITGSDDSEDIDDSVGIDDSCETVSDDSEDTDCSEFISLISDSSGFEIHISVGFVSTGLISDESDITESADAEATASLALLSDGVLFREIRKGIIKK